MTKIALPGSPGRGKSPVVPVKRRDIPEAQRILLFVRAGGRCEFNGCNCYLLEHHVTRKTGSYAQAAHIVAFSEGGSRGNDANRPREINNADNLMLLCHRCHKEVDDHPDVYTRKTLEEYKRRHERRIRLVTSLGPENATFVIIVTIPIAGEVVQIPDSQVWEAVAPRYPSKQDYMRIDLNVLRDRAERFIPAASAALSTQIANLFQPGHELEQVRHISLLAL